MKNKIGIFGGTFDPLHNGHIEVAHAALSECSLSKVIFMPNGNPPHKDNANITDAYDRYNMVSLAVEKVSEFEITDYEIKKSKPSYTIETMHYMKHKYDCPIYFIIGADSLYTIDTWYKYETLIKECSFIVADRNCKEGSNLDSEAMRLIGLGADITVLSMQPYDTDSTTLRNMIKNKDDCSRYIPKEVYEYIKAHGLYES